MWRERVAAAVSQSVNQSVSHYSGRREQVGQSMDCSCMKT